MRILTINEKCPKCSAPRLNYLLGRPPITGGPADHWDPGNPPEVWCPVCPWQPGDNWWQAHPEIT